MKEVRAAPGGIHSDLAQGDADALDHDVGRVGVGDPAARLEGLQHRKVRGGRAVRRSEEHTSELQSHSDLVCRLLLEKKKKQRKEVMTALDSRVGLMDDHKR